MEGDRLIEALHITAMCEEKKIKKSRNTSRNEQLWVLALFIYRSNLVLLIQTKKPQLWILHPNIQIEKLLLGYFVPNDSTDDESELC